MPVSKAEDELAVNIDWSSFKDHPAATGIQYITANQQGLVTNAAVQAETSLDEGLRDVSPTSVAKNIQLLFNDSALFFRQQLLARGPVSGSSFLIDKKKDIDDECGYPRWITPWQYRYMYDREGIATRVNDLMTNECFAIMPEVYETEDDVDTPFEADWKEVEKKYSVNSYIKRADMQSGIAYYGIMLLGLNDGLNLSEPVKGIDPKTGARLKNFKDLKLNYIKVFDETQVRILSYDGDSNSPRYTQPNLYYVRFLDVVKGETGAIAGVVTAQVHWTRIIHFADGRQSSDVFGTPRLQNVWNRLYDLRKILSASGEMFWKGGFPGFSFEVNPEIAAEVNFDEDAIREEFEHYSEGLQRYLALKGLTVKSLATQVSSPKDHFETHVRAICTSKSFPIRVFLGSEEQQRTTSTEEQKTWNKHVASRQEEYVTPWVYRPVVDRFVLYGIIRPPKKEGSYIVKWKDLNTVSDADQANLAFKRSQAMGQYINTFSYNLMMPKQFFVMVLGYTPEEADMIVLEAGGEAKILANLKKVFSMEANSADGGVQQKNKKVKGGSTTGDRAKSSGKATGEGIKKKKKPSATKKA